MPIPRGIQYLYHATPQNRVDPILVEGLIPQAKAWGVPRGMKIKGVIWLDSKPIGLRKFLKKYFPQHDYVILGIDVRYLNRNKLEKSKYRAIGPQSGIQYKSSWFTYKGKIPPEAIHVVG